MVFLVDDSGSMSSEVSKGKTRWDELKETFRLICDIAGHFDSDGFDIRFLNRPVASNVKSNEEIESLFSPAPRGSTNLIDALEAIYESPNCNPEHTKKKLLVIVMTDGLPDGNISRRRRKCGDLKGVMELVLEKHSLRGWEEWYYCSFVLCTEDDEVVSRYNEWDNKIHNFDVVDDYHSELREIRRHRGADFVFDRREYVAKIMLGSMDTYYDNLDEATNYFTDGAAAAPSSTRVGAGSDWFTNVLFLGIVGLLVMRWIVYLLS